MQHFELSAGRVFEDFALVVGTAVGSDAIEVARGVVKQLSNRLTAIGEIEFVQHIVFAARTIFPDSAAAAIAIGAAAAAIGRAVDVPGLIDRRLRSGKRTVVSFAKRADNRLGPVRRDFEQRAEAVSAADISHTVDIARVIEGHADKGSGTVAGRTRKIVQTLQPGFCRGDRRESGKGNGEDEQRAAEQCTIRKHRVSSFDNVQVAIATRRMNHSYGCRQPYPSPSIWQNSAPDPKKTPRISARRIGVHRLEMTPI